MADEIGCLMCRGKNPPPGAKCKTCGRAGATPRHECHADGCKSEIPPKLLFCARHWRMLPKYLQRSVWDAYVPGQEITKTPTAKYLDVMREAIRFVARAEGRAS